MKNDPSLFKFGLLSETVSLPMMPLPEWKCVYFLERLRWPNGISCPHCNSTSKHYVVESRKKDSDEKEYRCKDCDLPFSVKTKTVLSGTKVPISTWLLAASVLRDFPTTPSVIIAEKIKKSQKTAWNIVRLLKMDTEANSLIPDANTVNENLHSDYDWATKYLDFQFDIQDAISDHKHTLIDSYLDCGDWPEGAEYHLVKLDVAEFVINELLKDDHLLHEVVYPMMMKRMRKMTNRFHLR